MNNCFTLAEYYLFHASRMDPKCVNIIQRSSRILSSSQLTLFDEKLNELVNEKSIDGLEGANDLKITSRGLEIKTTEDIL